MHFREAESRSLIKFKKKCAGLSASLTSLSFVRTAFLTFSTLSGIIKVIVQKVIVQKVVSSNKLA